jgi:hypothetical protein
LSFNSNAQLSVVLYCFSSSSFDGISVTTVSYVHLMLVIFLGRLGKPNVLAILLAISGALNTANIKRINNKIADQNIFFNIFVTKK